MEHFLYYLLRASISMALFYGFYKLFFGKNTFHHFNRFSLLCIVMLVTVLPVFRFNLIPERKTAPVVENLPMDFSTIPIVEISGLSAPQAEIPWIELLSVVFAIGFLFALVRYLIGVNQLIGIIRKSQKQRLVDDTVLCVTDKDISPFSWMKYIVLSSKDNSGDNRAIINHERAHIHLHHSIDMIFLDLFTCFFWFNPFSWLLRREIQSVHEYQADEQVLTDGIDVKQYQLLLIRKSVGEHKFALANNFRQHDLHKRITMMMKNKTNKRMKWNYTVALPVMLLAMVALSIPRLNAGITEKATADSIETTMKEGDSIVLSGEFVDLTNDPLELGNVRIVAKEDSIFVSGKVREQTNTIHTEKKKVVSEKMKDGKVIGFGSIKGKEPMSVISVEGVGAQPLYILDGKEIETMNGVNPDHIASFSVLKNNSATKTYGDRAKDGVVLITTKKTEKTVLRSEQDKKPLVIIDGEIQEKDFELNSISPDKIASISVLKDQTAVELYGEEGKDGVIVITKKNALAGTTVIENNVFRLISLNGKNPLLLLDNKEVSEKELTQIDQQNVFSIAFFDGDEAVNRYGEKAKDGAVVLSSKKSAKK